MEWLLIGLSNSTYKQGVGTRLRWPLGHHSTPPPCPPCTIPLIIIGIILECGLSFWSRRTDQCFLKIPKPSLRKTKTSICSLLLSWSLALWCDSSWDNLDKAVITPVRRAGDTVHGTWRPPEDLRGRRNSRPGCHTLEPALLSRALPLPSPERRAVVQSWQWPPRSGWGSSWWCPCCPAPATPPPNPSTLERGRAALGNTWHMVMVGLTEFEHIKLKSKKRS